jgi:hypothetical protein
LKLKLSIVVIFSALVVVFSQFGCKSEDSDKAKGVPPQEGFIEYETSAIDQQHPLASLAPNSVVLKYKKQKFVLEMSIMGIFNTKIIGDLKAKEIAQTVKFIDIKQVAFETEEEIKKENDAYKLNFEETGETKKIAGYKCYRLKVNRVDSPEIRFDAYYTKDLDFPPNCNDLTPYAAIKGVFLDYRLKKMGLELRFLAKTVKREAIPDNAFDVPSYMKVVSKEEMKKVFTQE